MVSCPESRSLRAHFPRKKLSCAQRTVGITADYKAIEKSAREHDFRRYVPGCDKRRQAQPNVLQVKTCGEHEKIATLPGCNTTRSSVCFPLTRKSKSLFKAAKLELHKRTIKLNLSAFWCPLPCLPLHGSLHNCKEVLPSARGNLEVQHRWTDSPHRTWWACPCGNLTKCDVPNRHKIVLQSCRLRFMTSVCGYPDKRSLQCKNMFSGMDSMRKERVHVAMQI